VLGPWQAWQGVVLLASLAMALVGGLGVLLLLERRRQRTTDRWRRRLDRHLQPLRQLGLEPAAGESLGAFCGRVALRHPELEPALVKLEQDYSRLRFAPAGVSGRGPRPWRSPGFALALLVRRLRLSWLTMHHWPHD